MFRPDVFTGVTLGLAGLLGGFAIYFMILAVAPELVLKINRKTKSDSGSCMVPLIFSLIFAIIVGIISALSFGEYLKKGNYSEHQCITCEEPASYKVYNGTLVCYYCTNHYDDALYQYSGRHEQYQAIKANQHPCAICGKTEGTTQINNSKIGGKWDENWYCKKHYADAWQYYYGDGK